MAVALMALALLTACGDRARDREAADTLTTTVDTVAGIVHVLNSGAAPWWDLTPVASIGPTSVVGDESPSEFGRVVSVALDPSGETVYVADQLGCEIKAFGIDGSHLGTFGRCGEGPGEFTEFFYSIAWAGDRLLALDFGGARIGELSADGEWLGQRKTFGTRGGSAAMRFYPVASNEVYATQLVSGGDGRLSRMWVGHSAQGETPDTIPWLPPTGTSGITCEWGEGMVSGFTVPYGSTRLQHPGPGGVVYSAMTDEYKIVATRGGDTVRIVERNLPVEEVTDEEWAAVEADWDEFLEQTPGASCQPRRPSRPVARPVLAGLFAAPGDRLFVEVARTDGNYWEVFDTDGALTARIPAPNRKSPSVLAPAFNGGLVATIRQDSLELDHVDVYRIEETR